MSKFVNRIDQIFDRLTVIEYAGKDKRNKTLWHCQCICGNTIIVGNSDLTNKNTKSCGCLKKELTIKRNLIHGMYHTAEYGIWGQIVQRCTNPNSHAYKNYGGRSITICDEWRNDFMAFFKHVGKRPSPEHTIDRINNNSGYCYDNVRWATLHEQANNRRSNHNITLYGWTMNVCQWAAFVGINRTTIESRLKRNKWPPAKAIFQPVKKTFPINRCHPA